ncbi:uroporphyrinogen-III synthase [Planktosalinus lacus]|uniref:Uroporphyrinogen III methyltransferase n=1 Tax=Planktosalinus lacus TaxID=1526573 RepID=A0A8J2YAR0_9FLAO|nr:uroporphyrinogen-III synthase [Planktosalinus lacus]GGD94742.1 uroporphyrinogen III methyltransferase [Planktosalinus lacus]
MPTVLSTKKLTESQRSLLLQAGISLVEYNAIAIRPEYFEVKTKIDNAIITSQNTVKALLDKKVQIENCFCVGKKTKELLEGNGYKVKVMTNYGKELAEIIVDKFADESFTFFCGNLRRDEIPELLKKHKVNFTEIEVYQTVLKPKNFERTFDGVLFFSPSAVDSFTKGNNLKNTTAFCIGTTTAAEVGKYTNEINVATKPTIENVIVQIVKYFKKYK